MWERYCTSINKEKGLVGAFFVITNLRIELFEALLDIPTTRFPCVGDVRGCGLVQSLEIVEDKEGKVGTNNHNNNDKKLPTVSRWPARTSPRRSCSG